MRTTLTIVIALLVSMSGTQQNTAQQQSAKTQQSAAAVATPSLVLSPCSMEGTSEKVKCGTYEVYENRQSQKGRKISLKIVSISYLCRGFALD